VAAVGVQWEALLGQLGVVGHQEATHVTHIGAGHVVGCHGALVVVRVHPPAQQVPVLQDSGVARGCGTQCVSRCERQVWAC
jgi:hypothetical protein